MRRLLSTFSRFAGSFRRTRRDAEMSAEMEAHIDALTARNIARGMSAEDARYAALREFGGVEQIKERCRDERKRGWVWMEQTVQDVRYGVRQMRRSPVFTIFVILSLSLGIGANTGFFTLLDELLLRPMPVNEPDRLVRFTWRGDIVHNQINCSFSDTVSDPSGTGEYGETFTWMAFERFQRVNTALSSLFAFATQGGHTAIIDGQAEAVGTADYVTGEFFDGLGVHARLGRTLTALDDTPSAAPVAVISSEWWHERFGGDPRVLGKSIVINGRPFTIVGVAPPGFTGAKSFGEPSRVILPMVDIQDRQDDIARPGFHWHIEIMGRLAAGKTAEQATAVFQDVFRESTYDGSKANGRKTPPLDKVGPDFPRLNLVAGSNGSARVRIQLAQEFTLAGAMLLAVLLIACLNVANLLLARGVARHKEIAVRLALGSGRARIVRQLLIESLLLSLCGGGLGILIAIWSKDLLLGLFWAAGIRHLSIDFHALVFVTMAATGTAVFVGMVSALQATRMDLASSFQSGAKIASNHRSRSRLSRGLIVAQVALSFVVLAAAGLFIGTLRRVRTADIGFRRDHLLLFSLDGGAVGYHGQTAAVLFDRIAERLRQLPEASAATYATYPLVANSGAYWALGVPGHAEDEPEPRPAAALNQIGPGFFGTYGQFILEGRDFRSGDESQTRPVIIVNHALAEKYFKGKSALGQKLRYSGKEPAEIVGIVNDVAYNQVQKPPPTMYAPFAADPNLGWASFTVRTRVPPEQLTPIVRRIVHEIEPKLPLENVRTQEQQIEWTFGAQRNFAWVTSLLGGTTFLLVCIGLVGLLSYSVISRTREIGVRLALGALPSRVVAMFFNEAIRLVIIGLACGVVVATAATRAIASFLYGVGPTDFTIFLIVGLAMLGAASAAALIPARNAARVDPMTALRCE